MDSLYQRLKELDSDTFQRFCAQLLTEKHPGANIQHVEGASGDEGLDVFSGVLAVAPTIWQCKSFPRGVGKSQKEQIKQSLREAIGNFKPKRWILCLSVDMDSKAHRWFQRLQKSYKGRVEIGLLSATHIVHELMHRRTLRNHFFPAAAIDVTELKGLLTRTGELTDIELNQLNETNIEQFLSRLKDRDARFNYELVFNGEGGPPESTPRRGLVMSMTNGAQTINVLARDIEALKAAPPHITSTFQGTGIAKLQSLIRTGAPQEFTSSEMTNIRTDWELFKPLLDTKDYKVTVGPGPLLHSRRIRTRLIFQSSEASVEYGFVEFAISRMGTDEAELLSVNDSLPFQLSFVVPFSKGKTGSAVFRSKLPGHDIRDVQKFMRALEILRQKGQIQFFDLETSKELFQGQYSLEEDTGEEESVRRSIDQMVRFADLFGVTLRFPETFSDADKETFMLLSKLVDGEEIPAREMTISLVKSEANENIAPQLLSGPFAARVEHRFWQPKPKLFGVEINTGPCAVEVKKAHVKNVDLAMESFKEARIGDVVQIALTLETPLRFHLIRESAHLP